MNYTGILSAKVRRLKRNEVFRENIDIKLHCYMVAVNHQFKGEGGFRTDKKGLIVI
ncbi:MAG: hypothetical protein HFJ06_11980 [Lachnospiraceae bacterium]|nr:hypothetical protein [Lachnospiraceae bacterium]